MSECLTRSFGATLSMLPCLEKTSPEERGIEVILTYSMGAGRSLLGISGWYWDEVMELIEAKEEVREEALGGIPWVCAEALTTTIFLFSSSEEEEEEEEEEDESLLLLLPSTDILSSPPSASKTTILFFPLPSSELRSGALSNRLIFCMTDPLCTGTTSSSEEEEEEEEDDFLRSLSVLLCSSIMIGSFLLSSSGEEDLDLLLTMVSCGASSSLVNTSMTLSFSVSSMDGLLSVSRILLASSSEEEEEEEEDFLASLSRVLLVSTLL